MPRTAVPAAGVGPAARQSPEPYEFASHRSPSLVHVVWIDGHYDIVRFQEVAKYGRASGVDFGPVDVVGLAEAFGVRGFKIDSPEQISAVMHLLFRFSIEFRDILQSIFNVKTMQAF